MGSCPLIWRWVIYPLTRVVSPLIWAITVITIVTLIITPLITTHGPPSRG